jgi:membrane fusion protein, multidrug efflux system
MNEPTTQTESRDAAEAKPKAPQQAVPQRERQYRRARIRLRDPKVRVVLAVGILLLLAGVFFLWRYFGSYESTDDAQVDGHVNAISARITGHVAKINVQDNQYVQPGTVLVEIDPADYQVAVDRARADYQDALASASAAGVNVPITSVSTGSQLSASEANVENARAGVGAAEGQLQAANANTSQAEANNAKAQADLQRYKQLVDKQEISQQQYDQAQAAAKASAATVDAARAAAETAGQSVVQARAKLAQAGADLRTAQTAPQQVSATRSKAESAKAVAERKRADLEQAELNLKYTRIIAPVAGVVSNRTVEIGQNIQPGQALMNLIPLDDLWITANFKETQLRRVRPGQPVEIKVDVNGKKYRGHVDSIAGASGARFSLLPPENATGNYVKVVQRIPVKIAFEQGETKEHVLRPGMSVEPKVWIRE